VVKQHPVAAVISPRAVKIANNRRMVVSLSVGKSGSLLTAGSRLLRWTSRDLPHMLASDPFGRTQGYSSWQRGELDMNCFVGKLWGAYVSRITLKVWGVYLVKR
jgi:hypothetical protein